MVIRNGDGKKFKGGRLMFFEGRFLQSIFLERTRKIQKSKEIGSWEASLPNTKTNIVNLIVNSIPVLCTKNGVPAVNFIIFILYACT
jgi:hypothetical protein